MIKVILRTKCRCIRDVVISEEMLRHEYLVPIMEQTAQLHFANASLPDIDRIFSERRFKWLGRRDDNYIPILEEVD